MHNYLEDDLSLIERTAQRVKPIIETLKSHLVAERKLEEVLSIDEEDDSDEEKSHFSIEQVNDTGLLKANKKVNK